MNTLERTLDLAGRLEDTLDTWTQFGDGLNSLACDYVREVEGIACVQANDKKPLRRGRKAKTEGDAQVKGLRKKIIKQLEHAIKSTGIDGRGINKALQYYALGQVKGCGWIADLKSESKAKLLKSLVRWHHTGCKYGKGMESKMNAIRGQVESDTKGDVGKITLKQLKTIVDDKLGKKVAEPNHIRSAVQALLNAIEGVITEDGTVKIEPATAADTIRWLQDLFAMSENAFLYAVQAVDAHNLKIMAIEEERQAKLASEQLASKVA